MITLLSKLKYLRACLVPSDDVLPISYVRGIDQPLKEFCLATYKSYVQNKSIHDLDEHVVNGLHTLGVVNTARGKAILKDLCELTQLRKLGVTGINKKNCKDLCSAIINHGRLLSLSICSEGEPGLELRRCLDKLSPPPDGLHSLKLYGYLVKLPTWIE